MQNIQQSSASRQGGSMQSFNTVLHDQEFLQFSDMIYRKTDLALKMRAVKDDPAKRMQVLTAPETLMSQTMLGDIMDKTYKVARKASIDISVVRYDAPAGIGLRAPRPLIWGTETFMKAAQHVMTRVESLYIKHATGMDMGNRTRASLSLPAAGLIYL